MTASRTTNHVAATGIQVTQGESQYSVQSVDRAARILRAFSAEKPRMSLGEIANAVELAKPTAFRLLATLRENGLVQQHEDSGKYELGFGLLPLAQLRLNQTDLRDLASPHMLRLRNLLHETVVLSVRSGNFRVHVNSIEGTHAIRRVVEMGEHVPIYLGAPGKVLLSGFSDDELETFLERVDLVPSGPHTVRSVGALRAQVEAVRELGYAVGRGERAPDGAGIAVPLRNPDMQVLAALHVALPQSRFNDESQDRILTELQVEARKLEASLGAQA